MIFCFSPSKHPFVNEQERTKIAVGKTECTKEEISHIPYSNILQTASVWAVWLAAIGNFTCVNVLFLYSPTYLHRTLGFEMSHTGLAAAIPPLLQFLIKLFAGFTSDKVVIWRLKCFKTCSKSTFFRVLLHWDVNCLRICCLFTTTYLQIYITVTD